MLREVADPEMVATLTASRMVTACLVIAGGWLEIPVEMAPVIDVGGRCCYEPPWTPCEKRTELRRRARARRHRHAARGPKTLPGMTIVPANDTP